MIRLDLKRGLIQDCCDVFLLLNRFGNTNEKGASALPRSFVKRAVKTVNRDFKKGIREINKKAKVYIELPTLKSEGDGMYSEKYEDREVKNKEIIVNSLPVVTDSKAGPL